MIELGGKERDLKYEMASIRRLQRHFRQVGEPELNFMDAFGALSRGRVELAAELMWAALLHEEPGLEIPTVETWIDEKGDLEACVEAITEAFVTLTEKKKR